MLEIMKPAYYDNFICTANMCKDSCCDTGWNIQIDADTYMLYQNLEGNLGEKLRNYTSKEEPHYFLQNRGKCPFYCSDGLCELHTEGRIELQSETCKNYPRFATAYNDFFDLSLTISCPEVAKLIINCKKPISFLEETYEDEQTTTVIAPNTLETFRAIRKYCIEIIQIGTEPLWRKVCQVSEIALRLHQWYQNGASNSFFADFDVPDPVSQPNQTHQPAKFKLIVSLLECLENFPKLTLLLDRSFLEMKQILNTPDFYEHYNEIRSGFDEDYKEYLYIYENYIVYYLHQNFLIGLVEKNQPLNKEIIWMVLSCSLLKLCAETVWYKKKHEITIEQQIDIIYTFSRVFEHGIQLKEAMYQTMCNLGDLELCEPEQLALLLQ